MKLLKVFSTPIAAAFLLAGALSGQVASQANSGYRTEEQRQSVAKTLANPERDAKQKPKELVDAMGLERGMTVADIGTGIGYMLPWLSRAVGRRGRVLAEDIFDDFLASARQHTESQHLENVSFIKGTEKDPMLPAGEVDEALLLDVYHHFDYPAGMLAALYRELKPAGKLVIVEYYKRPEAMPNNRAMTHIRLDKDDVIKEIEANHFRLVSQREHVPGSQYMLILEKVQPSAPAPQRTGR